MSGTEQARSLLPRKRQRRLSDWGNAAWVDESDGGGQNRRWSAGRGRASERQVTDRSTQDSKRRNVNRATGQPHSQHNSALELAPGNRGSWCWCWSCGDWIQRRHDLCGVLFSTTPGWPACLPPLPPCLLFFAPKVQSRVDANRTDARHLRRRKPTGLLGATTKLCGVLLMRLPIELVNVLSRLAAVLLKLLKRKNTLDVYIRVCTTSWSSSVEGFTKMWCNGRKIQSTQGGWSTSTNNNIEWCERNQIAQDFHRRTPGSWLENRSTEIPPSKILPNFFRPCARGKKARANTERQKCAKTQKDFVQIVPCLALPCRREYLCANICKLTQLERIATMLPQPFSGSHRTWWPSLASVQIRPIFNSRSTSIFTAKEECALWTRSAPYRLGFSAHGESIQWNRQLFTRIAAIPPIGHDPFDLSAGSSRHSPLLSNIDAVYDVMPLAG